MDPGWPVPETLENMFLLGLRPTETAGEWTPMLVMADPKTRPGGTQAPRYFRSPLNGGAVPTIQGHSLPACEIVPRDPPGDALPTVDPAMFDCTSSGLQLEEEAHSDSEYELW